MKSKNDAYELASLGPRFIALVIDSIILGLIGGVFAGIFGRADAGGVGGFIIGLLYNWYFWTRNRGQTPGKMLMKVRVIKASGEPLTDADAVIRYIGYYINSALIMIGWIIAFFDDKNQGLHDKLVSTYVVKAE